MKKVLSIVLILCMVFALVGCGNTAEGYFKSQMKEATKIDKDSDFYKDVIKDLEDDELYAPVVKYYEKFLSSIDYKVLETEEVDENTTKLKVELKCMNFGKVMMTGAGAIIKETMGSFLGGEKDEKELVKVAEQAWKDAYNEYKDDIISTETTVIVTKGEDGEYTMGDVSDIIGTLVSDIF